MFRSGAAGLLRGAASRMQTSQVLPNTSRSFASFGQQLPSWACRPAFSTLRSCRQRAFSAAARTATSPVRLGSGRLLTSWSARFVFGGCLGASALFAHRVLLQNGAEAVQCESAALTMPAVETKATEREGIVRQCSRFLSGLLVWSIMIGIWGISLTMPFLLAAAAATQNWPAVAAMVALYAWPHLLPMPSLAILRPSIFAALRNWQGPPGTVRVIDLSQQASSEPEPEPVPAGQKSKQMYCCHPHGILSSGLFGLAEHIPGLKVCAGPFLHYMAPMFRFGIESLMGMKMGSAAAGDLRGYMTKGESPLLLIPGGFHEASITCPGEERIFLKSRKGFVKYALRYGYDLVPVYVFGENDLMGNIQGAWGPRLALNDLGIPGVMPYGSLLAPMFPRRGVELTTVIGPAVKMPKIENPTDEDVNVHHERYKKEIIRLYEQNKKGTACGDRPLQVW